MLIRKILIFTSFCLGINICHADYITFDTVALDTAMNEITDVGSDSPYKTVEKAGDALYDAFYAAKKGNTVDSDLVMDKCFNEIIKSGRICNKFINTYDQYLDKANYCLKANTMSMTELRYLDHSATFKDCYKYQYAKEADGFHGETLNGQCQSLIKAAEQCQTYLISYYKDKLDNSGISESDKKRYECLLEKVQTGNIEFPTSKMEQSCK